MSAVRIVLLMMMVGLAVTAGCGKRADNKSGATALQKVFSSANPAPGAGSNQDMIQAHAAAAIAALQTNNSAIASDELMTLQRLKGLTAEQRMAVNDVSDTLAQELIARSAKGDLEAKAILERRKTEMDRR